MPHSRCIVPAAIFVATAFVAASPARATEPAAAASTAAQELVAGLQKARGEKPSMVFMAPFRTMAGDAAAQAFVRGLTNALSNERGVTVADRQSVMAALREAKLTDGGNDAVIAEIASAFGADIMVTGSVDGIGDSYTANVRGLVATTAEILTSVTVSFTGDGGAVSTEARTLQAQLRRLGDRLARGLEQMEGDMRYQRIAVLPFEEVGASTRDKELGLLVASELITVLRRDHGAMLIERAQLKAVIDEMALGQSGVVEESQAIEFGRVAGAQGLVIGSVAEAGDRYLVNARVISAESGEVLVTEHVPLPAADLVALSSEAVVLRTRSGAIYRSLLLPGWGQFYNRESLKGGIIAGSEVAAIGAALALHFRGVQFEERYNNLGSGVSSERFRRVQNRSESAYSWRNIAAYAAIGIHLLSVADALISGKTFDPASIEPGVASAAAWRF